MKSLRRLAFVLMTVVAGLNLASVRTSAQQITGSIRGTVLDPSGASVQAAAVTAKQVETGLTRSASTDRQGAYVLVELPIGHYQIEVHAQGFQSYLQQGISLDVNETATVSVHLKVGSADATGSGECGCRTGSKHSQQSRANGDGARDSRPAAGRPRLFATRSPSARCRATDPRTPPGRWRAARQTRPTQSTARGPSRIIS